MVPVYNVEKYIKTCIESVLHQTYQGFNLILVDDGSPDQSGKICDNYVLMDERIDCIHQDNMGLMATRQVAIKRAHEIVEKNAWNRDDVYLIYLDSDDSLKKNALEKIQHIICKEQSDLVIFGLERVPNTNLMNTHTINNGFEGTLNSKRELYKKVFSNNEYNSLCRKAVSILLTSNKNYIEYYNIMHGEDLIQSIAYYKDCKKVFFVNESLYNYTVNPESITQSESDKNYKVDFTVRQVVVDFLKEENVFDENDWMQYTSYCIQLILANIKMVLGFNITKKRKIAYLKKIRSNNYYRHHVHNQKYEHKLLSMKELILYRLFDKKCYFLICCFSPLVMLKNSNLVKILK